MENDVEFNLSRRKFLLTCLSVATPIVIGVRSRAESLPEDLELTEAGLLLTPTPEIGDDDDPTPPAIEGPYFKPNSPKRSSLLERGIPGTKIVLTGRVFSRTRKPIARALLDFWHANDQGEYDNVGYKLRGHQFTDEEGRYRLETIVPGEYPGRTRHIHVKVQAPNSRILTTQLFFPGEPRNKRDFIFRPELLMSVKDAKDGKQASFNFVLNLD